MVSLIIQCIVLGPMRCNADLVQIEESNNVGVEPRPDEESAQEKAAHDSLHGAESRREGLRAVRECFDEACLNRTAKDNCTVCD